MKHVSGEEAVAEYEKWNADAMSDVEYVDSIIAAERKKDPEALFTDLDTLTQWLARSGELVSDAEFYYDLVLGYFTEQTALTNNFPPSVTSSIARGKAADVKRIYRRIERQNRALVHTIDALRTLMSYQKEMHKKTGGQ